MAALLREQAPPEHVREMILRMLPDLLALGKREHFLTDYGDEATYTLPWDLFTQESAKEALAAAQRSFEAAKELVNVVRSSWGNG